LNTSGQGENPTAAPEDQNDERRKTERRIGCATLLALLTAYGLVYWSGKVWLETLFPAEDIGGFALALDLGRPLAYLLVVGVPGLLALWLLKVPRFELWRGVGLSMVVASLYATLLGVLQAFENQMIYPGLPDWLMPLLWVLLSGGLLWLMRGAYRARPSRNTLWLGAATGLLVPLGYALAGAPGTPAEAALAMLEALALALAGALLASLPFYFQPEYAEKQPLRTALLAALALWAFSPTLLALRGYWIQGRSLAPVLGACGLLVGGLLVFQRRPGLRRTWPAAAACLFLAMAIPLILTDGLEGDWMPQQMSQAWSQAGYLGMLIAVVLGGLLLAVRTRLVDLPVLRWLAPALAGIAGAAFLAVYLLSGGPGLQSDMFFVVLKDQSDTSFALEIEDWQERRQVVFDTLTGKADESQASLRDLLKERGADYTSFYLVNALEVHGNGLRGLLTKQPDVQTILESPQARPLRRPQPADPGNSPQYQLGEITWNIQKIEANRAWEEVGITGEGIVIGIADSGVDAQHPALAENYHGQWYDPWEGALQPVDEDGHGTGTAGVALGQDGIGVAPGAVWIGCRNLARNLGNPGDYLRCMQFLFAPFPAEGDPLQDGDPSLGAHLTSNSWGCPAEEGCDLLTLGIGVENLANAGQLMVVSAGNEGPSCYTVGAPANAPQALSVGATDKLNLLAYFSSRGPADDGAGDEVTKPDFVAPGSEVLSSWAGGGYNTADGTSFAGPHLAGTVALMWSANPALIGDLETTRRILAETATGIQAQAGCGGSTDDQNNAYGYGVINAYAAVQQALALAANPEP